MNEYKSYLEAKNQTETAKEWEDLKSSRDSQTSSLFKISKASSKLSLTYCGQHSCGGQNYWEAPKALTRSILDVIYDDFDMIIDKAVKKLEEKEKQALRDCKEYAENILLKISEV